MLLAVALLAIVLLAKLIFERRKNYPPGPISLPLLGSFRQTALVHSLVHKETEKLGARYGDLIFFKLFMDQPLLIVRGYENIKAAMHDRAFLGVGQPLVFREHGLHRRLGVIFTDGTNWQSMRRFTVRALRERGLGRSDGSSLTDAELPDFLQRMTDAAAAGSQVEVRGLFTCITLNIVLRLTVGKRLEPGPKMTHIMKLVDFATHTLGPSFLHLDLFPWLRYVAPQLSGYRRLHDGIQELVDFFRPVVAERRAHMDAGGEPEYLVDEFLQKQRDTAQPHNFSDDNLLTLLKDLMMAGMDTTSTVMEWLILHLARLPEVQERAANEVLSVIGRERKPQCKDMASMPYTRAVLDETLRWMTPIPVIQHATSSGPARLSGYDVPAHCRVLYDFQSVHQDRSFWGDPQRFRPERFLVPNPAKLRERIMSFGSGHRRCIGEGHALQSMFLYTVSILQKLRVTLVPCLGDPTDAVPSLVLKTRPFSIKVQFR